ncbi:uncharacterized protein LOC132114954 [Carassius carassius]|uniref:uncharacterized protein LOC132114954 n=1 Tax=Carassius carassius TaxID=217509 RepID=UPI0028694D57|nr:uncharacterized protein LOC132114954 [Carassius carassius]
MAQNKPHREKKGGRLDACDRRTEPSRNDPSRKALFTKCLRSPQYFTCIRPKFLYFEKEYLKQKSPEEWTLRMLKGFSVSPDVIFRVFCSKFTPTAVGKLKQDLKVLASTGPQSLRDGKTEQTRLPKTASPAILLSVNTLREAETGLMSSSGNIVPSQLSAEPKVTPALQEQSDYKAEMDMRGDIEFDLEWDGVILTEEELEHIEQTLKEKPSPVKQKGKEFFVSEGKFLYSI